MDSQRGRGRGRGGCLYQDAEPHGCTSTSRRRECVWGLVCVCVCVCVCGEPGTWHPPRRASMGPARQSRLAERLRAGASVKMRTCLVRARVRACMSALQQVSANEEKTHMRSDRVFQAERCGLKRRSKAVRRKKRANRARRDVCG